MTTKGKQWSDGIHTPKNDAIQAVLDEYERNENGYSQLKNAKSFRRLVNSRIALLREHYKITTDPVIRARMKATIEHNRKLRFDPDVI